MWWCSARALKNATAAGPTVAAATMPATAPRSLDDLYQIIAFFEERRGRLHAFRWRDPMDWKSCPPNSATSPLDQVIGTGTGTRAAFQLQKTYGSAFAPWTRDIKKPVAGTLKIAVAGVEQTAEPISRPTPRPAS